MKQRSPQTNVKMIEIEECITPNIPEVRKPQRLVSKL